MTGLGQIGALGRLGSPKLAGGNWWLSESALDLDFANNRAFNRSTGFNGSPNGILTYTSPSPKLVYGADGVLFSSSGTLPYDHDPVTLEPLGVLIEEQRTNLLTYSEQFDNAAWTKSRVTITANAATAPDGTATADKLVEDNTVTATHRVFLNVTKAASATTYTASCYFKGGTRTYAHLRATSVGETNNCGVGIDLITGTLGTTYGGGFSSISATATDVGNGWYRVSLTFTTDTDTNIFTMLHLATDNTSGSQTYTGDGVSGAYFWGAQLEAGAFPTSYIPTVASQVTRAKDQVGIATSAFAYNAAEGTLVAEFKGTPGIAQDIVWLANGLAESIAIYVNALLQALVWCRDDGVTQAAQPLPGSITGVDKVAYAFAANDFTGSLNGASVATDTSGTMPTPTELKLNPRTVASATGNVHIKRLTYFSTRKTNAELQALTA